MVKIDKNGSKVFISEDAFENAGLVHFDTLVRLQVARELDHIAAKYPNQRLSPLAHIAVITEEWGESVEAILKRRYDDAQQEIAQTIACLVRLSHEIDRVVTGQAAAEAHLYQDPQ